MAAKTLITIQDDERGTVIYDCESKDFNVWSPAGELLGYASSPTAAREMLNAWHYDNAKAAA